MTLAYLELGKYEGVPVKVKTNFIKWVSMARAVMRQGTQTPDDQGLANAPVGASPPGAPTGLPGGGAPQMPGMPMMPPGMPGVPGAPQPNMLQPQMQMPMQTQAY